MPADSYQLVDIFDFFINYEDIRTKLTKLISNNQFIFSQIIDQCDLISSLEYQV